MQQDLTKFSELAGADMGQVRAAIRSGRYSGHTAGLAHGKLQCNLAILPGEYADAFTSSAGSTQRLARLPVSQTQANL
jgi:uncharacterized protein YcsI (UPF0317 family)